MSIKRGDVDQDDAVDVADVAYLINYLLSGSWSDDNVTSDMTYQRGDVDHDGEVDVADVACLISYLLNGNWPDDPVNPNEPVTETITVNGVSFKMIAVQGGTFTMGANDDAQEYMIIAPQHEVTLSSFAIGETEVTQELWVAVMGENPSYFQTGNLMLPVECIDDLAYDEFIDKLNELTGRTFHLPTEAQWEFAARGGNLTHGYTYAGSNDINEVAWCNEIVGGGEEPTTHVVATKAPNELGLYDMSGNVCEILQDYYGSYSTEPQTNPTGPEWGMYRVMRGGAVTSNDEMCRVFARASFKLTPHMFIGLRLAL